METAVGWVLRPPPFSQRFGYFILTTVACSLVLSVFFFGALASLAGPTDSQGRLPFACYNHATVAQTPAGAGATAAGTAEVQSPVQPDNKAVGPMVPAA